MRLDDPRLLALAGTTTAGPVGDRLVRRGVGRPPPVHRRGPARGRPGPARPAQALPADLRPVRRAPLLRRRAISCGRRRPGSGSGVGLGICEDFWHLAVPQLLALDGAQLLVNVSSSPGRDLAALNEVGPRHGDLVADADADLRPADDELRRLRQPGRRRRVDLVLGRLGGDRPERRRALQRAALRRGPVLRRRRPGRRPARADRPAPAARRAARAGRPRARADRQRAGRPGRDSTAEAGAEPGLDVAAR